MTTLRDAIIASTATMLAVAVGISFLVMWGNMPAQAFVSYSLVEIQDTSALCPGDVIRGKLAAEIKKPAVVDVYVTWSREDGSNVVGQEQYLGVRAFAQPVRFYQELVWVVPDFPPGTYERVTSITNRFADVRPWFVRIPFVIRDDCKKEEEQ